MTTKNSRILATLAVACVALLCTDASAGWRDFFTIAEVDRPRAEEHGFQGVALNDAGAGSAA